MQALHSVEETLQVQLADQYLLGQLNPEQAERAERAILGDPRLQQRAVVTQRLIAALRATRVPAATATLNAGQRKDDRDWFGLVSGAALVTIAVAGISWWAATAFWNNAPAPAEITDTHTIATANVASVELGLTRGSGIVPRLELSADQTIAIVALDVGIPETPVYRVQLYADDDMIWSTESARPAEDERIHLALKTKQIGSGDLIFLAQPADGLGNELRLPLKIVYRE